MKKFAIAAVAAVTILSGLTGTASAGEPVDGPSGVLCGFSSISNPQAEVGTQTGELDGGPLELINEETGALETATLTCTIQVNSAIHNGTSNDAVSASASGTGVVVLPPTVVSYQAGAADPVYLCSQITFSGGVTLYWHSSDDPTVEGHWSVDATSTCSLAISADGGSIFDPIFDELNRLVCPVLLSVPVVGPTLAGIWGDCGV